MSNKLTYLYAKFFFSSKTSKNNLIMLFSKQGETPKVKIEKRDNVSIVAVRKLNHIAYQGNEYEIPNEYNLNIVM